MTIIAINTTYVNLIPTSKVSSYSKGFIGNFSIESSLNEISISKDDKVIIALPAEHNDLKFESSGVITKVNNTKKTTSTLNSNSSTKFEHNFSIEIINDLNNNNLLSDLEYSLKSVYRFNKPVVHFQQQYRELPKEDYETIISGFVYYSRTAFGKLVNAIPRQNKLEFMLQAMDHFSTVNFKKIELFEGLTFLYDYINRRILSRGKLLIETNNLLENHLSKIVPIDEIGFYNPINDKCDNLSQQASYFNKLFALEKQSDITKIIKKNISENSKLEHRFMEIFKSETWPIDLTI